MLWKKLNMKIMKNIKHENMKNAVENIKHENMKNAVENIKHENCYYENGEFPHAPYKMLWKIFTIIDQNGAFPHAPFLLRHAV